MNHCDSLAHRVEVRYNSAMTKKAAVDSETEATDISAIKLFRHIQTLIGKINTPPLTQEALEINEDAYAELGSENDSGNSLIFARIGVEFPKRYTDLSFVMLFGDDGAALAVGGQEFIFSHYTHLGSDEKDIARKLINVLVGLANGQLAMLTTMTQDNEKIQAWEILYRKPGSQLYDALATYAMFDSARKLKNRELVTQKFANTADINDVDVDIATYKQFMFETNWLNKFNRQQIAGLHIPLTRADWEKSVDKYYDDRADEFVKKVDQWANPGQRTVWQQVIDAAKWRHLELLWWSLALILYRPITEWSLEHFHPAAISFGAFVLAATIYRRNPTFYKYYPFIRPLAYVSFVLSAIIYASVYDGSGWWITLGIVALVSLAENIFFDVHAIYTSRFKRKSSGKTRKK